MNLNRKNKKKYKNKKIQYIWNLIEWKIRETFEESEIDILRFSLIPVHFSFDHIDKIALKPRKSSQFKDQEIGVVDKACSGIETLLIDDLRFLQFLK